MVLRVESGQFEARPPRSVATGVGSRRRQHPPTSFCVGCDSDRNDTKDASFHPAGDAVLQRFSSFIGWSIHLTFFFLEALVAFAFADFSFLIRYCDYALRLFPAK